MKTPPAERYRSRLPQIAEPDECWPWTGTLDRDGYPIMWDGTYNANGNPHMVRAARWAAINLLGWKLGPRDHLLHSCDNPPCCNPSHWYAGSHSNNMRDRARAGYEPHNKRINSDLIASARRLRMRGIPVVNIAQFHQVSKDTIYRALRSTA